jgi:hypothetical protein
MERFSLKKLNKVEGKERCCIQVPTGFQLWKIWTLRWKLIVPGKRLERISKFEPRRV